MRENIDLSLGGAYSIYVLDEPITGLHASDVKTVMVLCGMIMVVLGLLFMAELNYFLGILTLKFEEISTFLIVYCHMA